MMEVVDAKVDAIVEANAVAITSETTEEEAAANIGEVVEKNVLLDSAQFVDAEAGECEADTEDSDLDDDFVPVAKKLKLCSLARRINLPPTSSRLELGSVLYIHTPSVYRLPEVRHMWWCQFCEF